MTLVCSKHESLTGEDTRNTWGISIESLMGERNKIECAKRHHADKKASRNGCFLSCKVAHFMLHCSHIRSYIPFYFDKRKRVKVYFYNV
jgi:hypothetical protein